MNTRRYITYTFIVIIALGFSGWFYVRSLENEPSKTKNKNVPDYFMENVSYTRFTEEGKIASQIQTSKALHYEQNNKTLFQKPIITVYQKNDTPWIITANQGYAYNDNNEVTLSGQVHITQAKGYHHDERSMTTEELTYYPKKQVATTAKKVIFKQEKIVIESIGMRAYLAEKRIQLLSQIRGRYASN